MADNSPGSSLWKSMFGLGLMLFVILLFPGSLPAQTKTLKVLILHSYHRELGWTRNISKGIDHVFAESPYSIDVCTEYMDTKRIFNPQHLENLARLLTYKYQNKRFDCIISSDDHAFQFLLSHHRRIFKDTPVVFCGVNYFKDDYISDYPQFTGVVEAFSIRDTINAALAVNPDLKQLFMVVDQTVSGKLNLKLLQEVSPNYEGRLTFHILTKMDMKDIQEKVSGLAPDSAVLLSAFTTDRSGQTFSLEESADLVSRASSQPVYSFWDFHLNHGILGGMITTGRSQGVAAAGLALRIMAGESPDRIPVIKTSPNEYIFDFNTMKKFGIPRARLPLGSQIINQPASFYQQNKMLVWQVVSSFGLLLLFTVFLSISLIKKRVAEARLAKSEERFDLAMKFANDGLFDWDLQTDAIYFSPGWKRILGYADHEIRNDYSEWVRLTDPADVKSSQVMIKLVTEGKLSRYENEFRMRHKDGHWVDILARGNVVLDSDGQAVRMVGTHVDVSQRKHEDQIKTILFAISNAVNTTRNIDELYHRIHLLLAEILDVTNFYIALLDAENQVLSFPYFEDTVEAKPAPVREYTADQSLTGRVVSEKSPLILRQTQLEDMARNGQVMGPLPKIWMGVPIMTKGEVIGVIAVQSYTDINRYSEQDLAVLSAISNQVAIAIDRKRAEDELRDSEKRYRHLFNHAPAGMFEVNLITSRFVEVNSILCDYTGYSEERLLSMNPLDLLTPDSRKRYLETLGNLQNGAETDAQAEYEIVTRNRETISVVLNADYLYDNGTPVAARYVVHDITERKRLDSMIIQSEKMMSVGGLAAGMAHEINNPLAGMIQNAQVIHNRLTRTIPANEDAARKLGTSMATINQFMEDRKILAQLDGIRTAGSRAAKIVQNMLSFARQGASVKQPCQISAIIDQTIEIAQSDYDLKEEYDFKNIQILKDIPPDLPPVFCEKSKIQQVLFNLFKNAAEAMSQGPKGPAPRLSIHARQARQTIVIRITDNGPGMDEKTRKRIFEPFFTTKDVNKGTGLGLSVSYFILVQEHKGNLEVISAPGKGTTFIVTLPGGPEPV